MKDFYIYKIVKHKDRIAIRENGKLFKSFDNQIKTFDNGNEAKEFITARQEINNIYIKHGGF